MDKTEQKTAIKDTENRTPLNLLSMVASLDPQEAFKAIEYRALFNFIEERFGIIYSIKELKKGENK